MTTLTITRDATPDAFDFLSTHRAEELSKEDLSQFVEPSITDVLPKVELIESDGEPMESDWHVRCMNLLLASIAQHFKGRDDYYAGGNMFIYYSEEQARNRDYRGPDFFLVKGVNRLPMRPYWCVWQEGGKHPDVIIELTSPTTVKTDLTTKKHIYETIFSTRDYFCYDPVKQRLVGWRLADGKYEPLSSNTGGQLWCEELQLWLGTWKGPHQGYDEVWLRFFKPDGQVVPTPSDFAEHLYGRAKAENLQAETERRRADAAEAELAQLRQLLAEKGIET